MGSHTSRQQDTQVVLDAIRRIVQALRESSRWAERHVGLTGAQLFVLQKIAESPAVSINGLAERTHTHQSSVSTVVARLVAQRLVRRTPSATDARRVELSLAARGERVVERAPDVAQERLIRGIQRLTATGRRHLAVGLGELARAVDDVSSSVTDAPAMFFEDRRGRGSRNSKRNGARTGTRNGRVRHV
jgi:DNA-binding MarR family transcriptional regulator